MKKLIFVIGVFICFKSFGQLYQNMPQYGYTMPRADVQLVLKIPSDTTNNKSGIARIGTAIYAGNGTYWTVSGSVLDTTSLSNRINLKADKANTLTINGTGYDLSANRSWSVGTVTGSGTTSYLPKFSSSTALANSLVYDDGTNIGIGTTSPAYKLHVRSSGTEQGIFESSDDEAYLRVKGNTVSGIKIEETGASREGFIGYDGNLFTVRSGSTSDPLILNYGGKTGIGTFSPDSALTVEQGLWVKRGVRLSGLTSAVGTKALRYNPGTGLVTYADTTASSGGTVTSISTGLGLSGGTITTSGTIALDTANASVLSRQRAANTYQPLLPSYTFGSVLFSNGTTIAQDNANLYWDTANKRLGIGTATPSVALDVVGQVNISQVLKLQPMAFASLPASPETGMIAVVNDMDFAAMAGGGAWGDIANSGGSDKGVVFYNGSNWTLMGK